ncbi:ribonuclease P protein subunit p21 [Takifugu rubripes]|nr:ribonuclease P protein subunit p21-like [Takifugu rubripes]|eukprot:XP_003973999.2 PREDICTED: ribonuclease P protein subunit p21-like [Takifugu rubripes]
MFIHPVSVLNLAIIFRRISPDRFPCVMAGQIKDKDAYQRLNYLYQAAHCVLSQNPDNVELARFYCSTQRTIARRLVLRQDPSVKRTVCKKCCSLLIPGVSATTRQRRKKGKIRFTVMRCLSCGHTKKLLNNPDYCLWADRPEAQLEQPPKLPGPGPSLKDRSKDNHADKHRQTTSVSSTAGAAQNITST